MDDKVEEQIKKYIKDSMVLYHVFCFDIDKVLSLDQEILNENDNCIILADEFLDELENLVNDNVKLEILDDEAENNIFSMLVFMRENDKSTGTERKEKIERYNEIIYNLNTTRGDINSRDFLLDEMTKRYINGNSIRKKINDRVSSESIKETFGYDITILSSFIDDNEDNFNNIALEMSGNGFYFTSLIKFINEIPEIFNDETVYIRAMTIFEINRKLKVQGKSIYKTDPEFMIDNYITEKKLIKLKKSLNK